jgi:hypothetical protein
MKSINKDIKIIGVILVVVILLMFYLDKPNSNSNNAPNEALSSNNKALAIIKKEPKVKEAIITDVNVLYVSVLDDGTNRNGYADYLCQILNENGSSVSNVKVVEVGTTNDPDKDNAYGVLLGESNCNY